MSLSPETLQRLDNAREKQFINPRNKDTLQAISRVAVRAVEGPFQSGKTTLSLLATEIAPEEFHYVPSHTTREQRITDPEGTIITIPNTEEGITALLDEVKHGDYVQYAIHPTEKTFYGTLARDYDPTKYNLIPMLAGRPTDYLIGSPFKDAKIIGIVATPAELEQRIDKAYRDEPASKLRGRLTEGINSTDFLIERATSNEAILVHNIEGDLLASAHALMEAVRGERESDPEGIAYLQRTKELFQRKLRSLATNGEDS